MGAVFLGTPAAAVPSLAALADVDDVELVVTRPDRPAGRGRHLTAPAVKRAAEEWGLPVVQPTTAEELLSVLGDARPDVGLVVAYGRILTSAMLATAPLGFLNVHFSLLPRWRGAAPVEHAILAGDARTGVTLMLLDEGLDTGPLLAAVETPIAPDETGGSLTARLAYLGAMLVDDTMPDYLAGRLQPAPQLEAGVSHAPRLRPEDARIDAGWTRDRALRAVRAFHPRPGAWVLLEDDTRLGILEAAPSERSVSPGVVETGDGAHLGLADGAIELRRVRPAGRRPMSGDEWARGRRAPRTRLVGA